MKDTYAILKISGLQYLVREGDIVDVKKSKELRPEVLLLKEDGKVTIGTPIVEGANIQIEVEKEFKEKVEVRRYRSKSRHRITKGFKYPMQRLVIKGINKNSKSAKEQSDLKHELVPSANSGQVLSKTKEPEKQVSKAKVEKEVKVKTASKKETK